MIAVLVSDLRHAARTLVRARGFTVVAVGTLAFALALSVCVMSVVNAYLLRGLPYPESDRLYNVRYDTPGQPGPRGMEALDWSSLNDIVEHPIAWDLDNFSLRGEPYPELAMGTWVTPGYMAGFGVRPALGRSFTADDFQQGRPSVALISHRLWKTRFGGDPSIVGRQFQAHVNDRPDELETFTVVGVLPQDMWHTNLFIEVLSPLRAPSFPYMVRLREGVDRGIAAARISALVRQANPALHKDWRAELLSAHGQYVAQVRPLLVSLAAATGLVLLIACANVAVLLLLRASRRRHEVAVRKALGATLGRLASATAAEAFLLGGVATMIGAAVAYGGISVLAPLLERQLGRGAPGGAAAVAIDLETMAAGIAIGLLVIGVCSAALLWASARTPVALALSGGQRTGTDGPAPRRARAALIAVEVAASLALLVGAALMVESGLRVLNVDMGLDTHNVEVGRISLRPRSFADAASRSAFFDRLHARMSAVPGVEGVAFTNAWPLQATPPRQVSREGTAAAVAGAGYFGASTDYFGTVGIRLREGRLFSDADRLGAPRVAVISETLARTLWPGASAIGERLRIDPPAGSSAPPASLIVVGIVNDVRHTHTDAELADVYYAFAQGPSPSVFTYMKTTSGYAAVERDIRAAIASVDSDLALGMARPLAEILDLQRAGSRFLASLLVVFALFAAVLALIGIYGVIAYAVRQREREIAVRMAVGADRRAVVKMFLKEGGGIVVVGLAMGLAGAVALGRLLEAQLFGVRGSEPLVLALAAFSFGACALVAVVWPARLAASTDPAAALKV